ncbi:hypothetical protein OS493_003774 [Desmophyllum pertusum]|uniref:Uncharacterized protein n=1 Tax=Desmophyllum pertusum TaxID=174260 RepID=A0A9X0A642_9CNID|nr:hypothetical protein OS493_003774 [Desmophyllum pertusum]
MNASLQLNVEKLQERLDMLDNTSESCFSQRISELQSQLAASEDELKTEAGENKLMKDEIEKSKETETKLQAMNASLQLNVEKLQERLDMLDNTSESCFSQRISELQSQLAASEDELKTEAGETDKLMKMKLRNLKVRRLNK